MRGGFSHPAESSNDHVFVRDPNRELGPIQISYVGEAEQRSFALAQTGSSFALSDHTFLVVDIAVGVEQASTCRGRCGTYAADLSCWCDPACESYGDCCWDRNTWCPAAATTGRTPMRTNTPPTQAAPKPPSAAAIVAPSDSDLFRLLISIRPFLHRMSGAISCALTP